MEVNIWKIGIPGTFLNNKDFLKEKEKIEGTKFGKWFRKKHILKFRTCIF